MKYKFDVIRSRAVLIITMLLVLFVPFAVLAVISNPDLKADMPAILYRNPLIPLLVFVVGVFSMLYFKKRLFWKELEIFVDKENDEITIGSKKYALPDLLYYDYQPGTLQSGYQRDVISIKFRDSRELTILPCKNSEYVANYDAFVNYFERTAEGYFSEEKEKPENKTLKYVLIAFLGVANIILFYFLMIDTKAAGKMVPGLLVAYGVFLPQIFKKRKRRRDRMSTF